MRRRGFANLLAGGASIRYNLLMNTSGRTAPQTEPPALTFAAYFPHWDHHDFVTAWAVAVAPLDGLTALVSPRWSRATAAIVPSKVYDGYMKRVLLSWSSGKDSAWALHLLRQQPGIELVGLLTTLNTEFQRVAMHGTGALCWKLRRGAQLPLWIVPLPWPCSNEVYEQRMTEVCDRAVSEHVDAIAFGDLFLQDVRAYRETQLKPTGWSRCSPLGATDSGTCP